MKRFNIPLIAAVLFVSCLAGCAALNELTSPKNQLVAQVAIQYATGKFIESEKQPASRILRAQAVAKVANDIKAVASSDSATIDALRILALSKVSAAHLQPADLLLATTLVDAAVQELNDKVSTGVLDSDARVAVSKLLDWIIGAAAAYG